MNDLSSSQGDVARAQSGIESAACAPPGYDLFDEVGHGGMGVVYRAHDIALNREVAVKVLQDRFAPDSATAARFLEEAQITGQLQHPGVPAVYHVGRLADGRPFLAMKLIKGDTLDALLKTNAPVDRLGVFAGISQAVGYAHAHGVIHRDLKPANVMVGAFGEVQVMDWGLAKVLTGRQPERRGDDPNATTAHSEVNLVRDSDTPFTQYGSALGTPAFMPPEQAAGELDKVDRRSDVFGLGAILCVLLTGKPPFEGKDAEAVRLNAVRGKTDGALARLAACGADPEVAALCRRCLAVEPNDRPATADEVAAAVAALRRAADDRAKQAELDRAKAEVRADEQRKRQRVMMGLAAVLLLGVGGTTWGLVAANKARGRAEANERKANDATAAEQEAAARATRKSEQFEQITKVLVGIFKDIDPARAEKGGPPVLRQLADRLKAVLPTIDGLAAEDREAAARLQTQVAGALRALGFPKDAIEPARKAHQNWIAVRGPDFESALTAQNWLAIALNASGQPDKALPLFEDVLARRRVVLGPDNSATLESMYNLAIQHYDMDRYDLALPLARDAYDRQRANPNLGPSNRNTLKSLNFIGTVYAALGRTDESVKVYADSLAQATEALGADHETTLQFTNDLASGYLGIDRPDLALPLFTRLDIQYRTMFGPDHPSRLVALRNIGAAYQLLGRYDRAAPAYEEAYRRRRDTLGADHSRTLGSAHTYGNLLQMMGDFPAAEAILDDTQKRRMVKPGPDAQPTVWTRKTLADLYVDLGRAAEAVALLEGVRTRCLADLGADHSGTWEVELYLALARMRAGGKPSEAAAVLESVLAKQRAKFGRLHRNPLETAYELAGLYLAAGDEKKAAALLEEAEAECREKFGPSHQHTARAQAELGRLRVTQKRFAGAETLLRAAVAFYTDVQPTLWRTAELKSLLGAALFGQKKYADAEPLLMSGHDGLRANSSRIPAHASGVVAAAAARLGELYTATGRPELAAKLRERPAESASPFRHRP